MLTELEKQVWAAAYGVGITLKGMTGHARSYATTAVENLRMEVKNAQWKKDHGRPLDRGEKMALELVGDVKLNEG